MNAQRSMDSNDVFQCPGCRGPLEYWASYDVVFCPVCEDRVYNPDTGEEQGAVI